MRLVRASGEELDANCDIEENEAGWDIIFHARYGGRNSPRATNTDYFPALELLLERLSRLSVTLREVSIDSRHAHTLPRQQRILPLPWPMQLDPSTDVRELRLTLTRTQRASARTSGARTPQGSNPHKRIRISIGGVEHLASTQDLAAYLTGRPPPDVHRSPVGMPYRTATAVRSGDASAVLTFDPARRERGLRGHATTQNALASWLRDLGLEPRSPAGHEPDFDLAWDQDGTTYVAEVKSLHDENEDRQLRHGLGQVLHYRYQLRQRRPHVGAVLAVEQPVSQDWCELCREAGVILSWPPEWLGLHPDALSVTGLSHPSTTVRQRNGTDQQGVGQ